jgi:hypothetical protein
MSTPMTVELMHGFTYSCCLHSTAGSSRRLDELLPAVFGEAPS